MTTDICDHGKVDDTTDSQTITQQQYENMCMSGDFEMYDETDNPPSNLIVQWELSDYEAKVMRACIMAQSHPVHCEQAKSTDDTILTITDKQQTPSCEATITTKT